MKLDHFDIAEGWYKKALTVNEGLNPNITLGQTQETIGHLYWKTDNIF